MRNPGNLLLVCAALILAGPTGAAEFAVDTTADEIDAVPGDGVCASPSGSCALRAGVMEANALPGMDSIELPAGSYSLDLTGFPDPNEADAAANDLDVTDALSIVGEGASNTSITGASDVEPVFDVHAGMVAFARLAIEDIYAVGAQRGAGIHIRSGADVRVMDAAFRNLGNCCYPGAAISSDADSLHVVRSRFEGNGSEYGSGIVVWGGTLGVEQSVFESNTGYDAAAIGAWSGTAVVDHSTFVGNSCASVGCAIHGSSNGHVTLRNSLVSGNGGLSSLTILHLGSGHIENTTVTGNTAFTSTVFASPAVSIANTTLTANTQVDGYALRGGTVENTIVAGNTSAGAARDCFDVTSAGHNLFGAACAASTLDASDLAGSAATPLDPGLAPLAANGGSNDTHDLYFASPAVDAGDPATCTPHDQRGVVRPVDGNGDAVATCDIGAVERKPASCDPAADCEGAPAPPMRHCGLGGELLLLFAAWRALRRAHGL